MANKPSITDQQTSEAVAEQDPVTNATIEVAQAVAEPEEKAKRGKVVQAFTAGGHIEGVMEVSDKIYEKPEGCSVKMWNSFFGKYMEES